VKGTVPLGRWALAWFVLLGGMIGFWLLRPWMDTMTFNNLQLLVLFTSSKFATLLCMPAPDRRALPWGRYVAYLTWPGMQPRLFLPTHSPDDASDPPTIRWTLLNLLAGVLLLWVVPLLLPTETPLVVRLWVGLVGFGFLFLFALMDAWALLYRSLGIGVGKLWVCPIAATSLNDFWGRRWNRIFSGMLREVLFLPLARRCGGWLAVFAVFLYSGLLHESTSVSAQSGYGGPMLYFLIQFVGVWLESPRWVQRFFQRWPVAGWLWTGLVMAVPLPLLLHPGFMDRVMLPSLVGLGVPGLPE
jgi:alginate O-acetyltransferase complex protein AlgI